MTRQPPRPPARVPGFAVDDAARLPAVAANRPSARRRASRQLNVRLLVDLYDRYRTLLRGLEDEGIDTSMSELVHALLDQGPEDVPAAIEVLRRWRRASSEL